MHQHSPISEKQHMQTIEPTSRLLEHQFTFDKSNGLFVFVPFTADKGLKGKFSIAIKSIEPGLYLQTYH